MSSKGKNKNRLSNRRKRHVVGKEEKYRQERDKSDKSESGEFHISSVPIVASFMFDLKLITFKYN